MRLICELSRKVNSTSLRGKCYENTADANKHIESKNYNDLIRTLNRINLTSANLMNDKLDLNTTNQQNLEYYTKKNDHAAIYIVVVLCFYSLSLVCLIFSNIRFNWVFRKSLGLRNCYHAPMKAELYDTQQQETKETIELLFSHSSKLLTLQLFPLVQKQDGIENVDTSDPIKNSNLICKKSAIKSESAILPPQKTDRVYDKPLKFSLV